MIGALLLIAWVANWLTKRVLLRGLRRALHASRAVRESDAQFKVVPRLANVVPALVLWLGVGVVPHLTEEVVLVVAQCLQRFHHPDAGAGHRQVAGGEYADQLERHGAGG